jgi:hypothetical protein
VALVQIQVKVISVGPHPGLYHSAHIAGTGELRGRKRFLRFILALADLRSPAVKAASERARDQQNQKSSHFGIPRVVPLCRPLSWTMQRQGRLSLLKHSRAYGKIAVFMDRSTAMDIALWIIAIVAILYLVVRLGLAWMVPDHYRGK